MSFFYKRIPPTTTTSTSTSTSTSTAYFGSLFISPEAVRLPNIAPNSLDAICWLFHTYNSISANQIPNIALNSLHVINFSVAKRLWPGLQALLLAYWCAFAYILHDCARAFVSFFGFGFFPCVVGVFVDFLIAKWVLLFFGMFYFGTLHSVLICVVLFVCLVAFFFFLHSGFLCAITCLPYLLQWFCASHFGFFFVPKCSLFCFLLKILGATSSLFCLSGRAICFFLCSRVFLGVMPC